MLSAGAGPACYESATDGAACSGCPQQASGSRTLASSLASMDSCGNALCAQVEPPPRFSGSDAGCPKKGKLWSSPRGSQPCLALKREAYERLNRDSAGDRRTPHRAV